VAEGRHRGATTGDNLRSCILVGEVAPGSTHSISYWSNLSTVTEGVAGNRQEWQKEAELEEAEVRQWEAAVAAIVSRQCRDEVGVAGHSADCYSDSPASTEGVANRITIRQRVTALRSEGMRVSGPSAAYWSDAVPVVARVAQNEQGQPVGAEVGGEVPPGGAEVLVAGPVGNAEEIFCVNIVAQADDRSEVTAGSADSGVIHVVK